MSSKENINGSVHSEKFEKVTKHTAKDSVFCDLFKIPKYLLQLYQALHPEDFERVSGKP